MKNLSHFVDEETSNSSIMVSNVRNYTIVFSNEISECAKVCTAFIYVCLFILLVVGDPNPDLSTSRRISFLSSIHHVFCFVVRSKAFKSRVFCLVARLLRINKTSFSGYMTSCAGS